MSEQTLGQQLKQAREAQNLTPEQVDAAIKIKPKYLAALEADDYSQFPSAPMLRGFIRNYAQHLGINPDEAITQFETDTKSNKRRLGGPDGIQFMEMSLIKEQSSFNFDTFITLIIIAALIGAAGFFIYSEYLQNASAQPAVPEVVEYAYPDDQPETAVTLPTPTPPPTDTPTPTPTPSPQYYTGVTVALTLHDRSWVQILSDDQKVFEGNLEAGEQKHWNAEKRIAIRAGNGGGVEVFVNGQNMGFMGETGQVIDQVWEKVEELPDAEPAATPATDTTPTPASE